MAITPANSNYKSFTYNGISARQYGVYITDVNVFDSAQRQVEYITIPGRNGQFALDHGRFENVTVKYSCAMGADSDTDFADAISDFRNAEAKKKVQWWIETKKDLASRATELNRLRERYASAAENQKAQFAAQIRLNEEKFEQMQQDLHNQEKEIRRIELNP